MVITICPCRPVTLRAVSSQTLQLGIQRLSAASALRLERILGLGGPASMQILSLLRLFPNLPVLSCWRARLALRSVSFSIGGSARQRQLSDRFHFLSTTQILRN